MYKLKKNKKGFSAIIAALLLMILTIALGVMLYAYVNGWFGTATKGGTIPTGQMSIDSIAVQSNGKYWVYVRNIGTSGSLTVDTAYINGVQASITGTSVVVNAGDVQKVELTMSSGSPASGDTIKVYASDGSLAQGTAP